MKVRVLIQRGVGGCADDGGQSTGEIIYLPTADLTMPDQRASGGSWGRCRGRSGLLVVTQ